MRYLTVVKKAPSASRGYKRKRYSRKKYPRKSRLGTGRTTKSRILTTNHRRGKHHQVQKMMPGIAPAVFETGGTMSDLITATTLKGTPNGEGGFSYTWKGSNYTNMTEMVKFYQYYKILGVTVVFYPEQNVYNAGRTDASDNSFTAATTLKAVAPQLIVAVDRTTSALFASTSEAMNHEGAKLHVFNGPEEFSISLVPTPLTTTGPVGATVTVPGRSTWIPTTNIEVEHFGLRCFLSRFGNFVSLRVVMQIKVEFKDLKL